jgi:hypothetical protein
MNIPDTPAPRDNEERVETFSSDILIEFSDTDPRVVHLPPLSREENTPRLPTWLLEQHLEAGYYDEETRGLVREELERRKKQPPPTS